jgi:hypothetical protein
MRDKIKLADSPEPGKIREKLARVEPGTCQSGTYQS